MDEPKSLAGGDSGTETSAQLRGKVESESIPQALRRRIEGAVEALGGRVTVGDVAARAGASLEDTERTLNALAADSQGVLQVGTTFHTLDGSFVVCNRMSSVRVTLLWLPRRCQMPGMSCTCCHKISSPSFRAAHGC